MVNGSEKINKTITMRLCYNGRTITDLKKFLEDKVKEEEAQELMEEKCEEEAFQDHA